MSAYRAFGDENRRNALIADIRDKGPVYTAWLTRASIEGDISIVSQVFGLHPALARLLPVLGAFGEEEDAIPFYKALLEAIPIGAETGGLARQILVLAWSDPTYGRSKMVESGQVRDACEEVIALVEQSIHAPVEKKAWRAARTELASISGEDACAAQAIDLIMSLAWDLDEAPGAAHDVMTAWDSGISAEADAADEDCFSAEESAAFETEINKINEEAMEVLSQRQSIESVSIEDFLFEAEKIWAADPGRNALKIRSIARRERTNAKMAAWRGAIQRRVLELAEASLSAPTPSQLGENRARMLDQARI